MCIRSNIHADSLKESEAQFIAKGNYQEQTIYQNKMIFKLINKTQEKISIKEFYERRNKILLKRECGGTGDILMQRMMFEDIIKKYPQLEVNYAIPDYFFSVAENHPYINPIDVLKCNTKNYGFCFNITTVCRKYEMKMGSKNTKHRSDIWAESFGVELENHNMHLVADENITNSFKEYFKKYNKKTVLLATKSTNDDFGNSKSLTEEQIFGIVDYLRKENYHICTVHNESQSIYGSLDVEQFINIPNFKNWLGLVNAVDCIISIDTSTFHMAGGLKKPIVGVFSFTNGKVYGKYYDFILVQKDLTCGPCFNLYGCEKSKNFPKPCMTEISSNEIINGFLKAKQKWNF